MSKLDQIPWHKPQRKYRTQTAVPLVTITSKAFKTGQTGKTAPYWRIAMNKAFMEKYYPEDPKIRRMSVYVGGQGVLVDIKPSKGQDANEIRLGNYFNDEELVDKLFKHFGIPILSKPNITHMHLHCKPGKKYDEKLIYEFVYIDDQNPELTQLEGLKAKLEADENMPEPDSEKPIKINVEG